MKKEASEIAVPVGINTEFHRAYQELCILIETLETELKNRKLSTTDFEGLDKKDEARIYEDAELPTQNSPYPIKALQATLNVGRLMKELIEKNGTKNLTFNQQVELGKKLTLNLGYLESRSTVVDWWAPKVRDQLTSVIAKAFLKFLNATKSNISVKELIPETGFTTTGGWDMRGQIFEKLPGFLEERIHAYEALTAYQKQIATYVETKPAPTPPTEEIAVLGALTADLPNPPETDLTGKDQLDFKLEFYTQLVDNLNAHLASLERDAQALQQHIDNIKAKNQIPANATPHASYAAVFTNAKKDLEAESLKIKTQQTIVTTLIEKAEKEIRTLEQTLESLNPDTWTVLREEAQQAVEDARAQLDDKPEIFMPRPEDEQTKAHLVRIATERSAIIRDAIDVLIYFKTMIASVKIEQAYLFPTYTIPENGIIPDELKLRNNTLFRVDNYLEGFEKAQKLVLALDIIEVLKNIRREQIEPGASSRSYLLGVPSALPEIPWTISGTSLYFAEACRATRGKITADIIKTISPLLDEQIRAYEQELAVEITEDSGTSESSSSSMSVRKEYQKQYQAELKRPEIERENILFLAQATKEIQKFILQQALIAQLAIERDFTLSQIESGIDSVNKLIKSAARQPSQKALQILKQSNDVLALQAKYDLAIRYNNEVLKNAQTQLTALNELKITVNNLPEDARKKAAELIKIQKQLLSRFTATLNDATTKKQMRATDAIPEVELKLNMAKIKTLEQAYQKLINETLPAIFNRPKRLQTLQSERKALEQYNELLETEDKLPEVEEHITNIKELQAQLNTIEKRLKHEIKDAESEQSKKQHYFDVKRENFTRVFFNGKLPDASDVYHSTEATTKDGVFNRYIKERHQAYFWTDLLTSALYFISGLTFKSDQVKRTEYLHDLQTATNAYAKDSSKKDDLLKLIDQGLKQTPDAGKTKSKHPTIFSPRAAVNSGFKYYSSLHQALSSMKRELLETEKSKPEEMNPEFSGNKDTKKSTR